MAYIAKADLLTRMDTRVVEKLTLSGDDPDGTAADDAKIDQAITDSESEVNGYLAELNGVTVPITDAVPALVKTLTSDIAIFRLYQIKNAETTPESIRSRYIRAIDRLEKIAKGEVTVVGLAVSGDAAYAKTLTNMDGSPRQFIDSNMTSYRG